MENKSVTLWLGVFIGWQIQTEVGFGRYAGIAAASVIMVLQMKTISRNLFLTTSSFWTFFWTFFWTISRDNAKRRPGGAWKKIGRFLAPPFLGDIKM